MPDVKRTSGGPSTPVTTLVQTDQETILGDGSHERPLRVADGVIGGGGGGGGGGSGGSATVTTDGTTVLGDGSPGDPIRAAPGGGGGGGGSSGGGPAGSFRAAYRGGSVTPRPGQPVFASVVAVAGADGVTVQPAAATNLDPLGSTVDGVVATVDDDGTVRVQVGGPLTLATTAWDAVTGMTGGLVPGSRYYLSPFPAFARLTDAAPTLPCLHVSLVGVALTAATMLLAPLPAVPRRNLDGQALPMTLTGQPLPVGSAVFVSADLTVVAATSSVSVDQALAVGVVVGYDNVSGTRPIVQFAGVVTLEAAQWDAVTNTAPGMRAGGQYFVDVAARPGNLTTVEPLAGAATQVGVGLSTTQLLLGMPVPRRLT